MRYLKQFKTRFTPQSQPIPGSGQVANNAGGVAWQLDDWKRLDRFLILGSAGGTYYVNERQLTKQNAELFNKFKINLQKSPRAKEFLKARNLNGSLDIGFNKLKKYFSQQTSSK